MGVYQMLLDQEGDRTGEMWRRSSGLTMSMHSCQMKHQPCCVPKAQQNLSIYDCFFLVLGLCTIPVPRMAKLLKPSGL